MRTRAPLRISFAGGGSDIEPYASEYGGCVLAAAIKYYAQAIYPSEPVVPSEMEQTIIDFYQLPDIVKLTNGAPQQSGLGGSAACFVAAVKAVRPTLHKEEIASAAFHLERNIMGIAGGMQDQYVSARGGLLYLKFDGRNVDIEKVIIPEGLARTLILVYMGRRVNAGQDIIKDQMNRMQFSVFHKQKAIARGMKECLEKQDLHAFGVLLDEAWQSKMQYSPMIACDKIKDFYHNCRDWGAIGGKLTGAGGGGYMLLMEYPEHGKLRKNLSDRGIKYLDVSFDTEGVKVL